MKSNIFKYVFGIIVVGLVVYAVYAIYGNKDKTDNKLEIVDILSEESIIDNIRIPIVDFDTINPILSKNQHIQNISRLVYEPLLNISEDYKIESCLAKEWSKTGDKSYIIKLKDGIMWNDGNLLTAKDVQFTIDMIKSDSVTSIYAYNIEHVIGVEVIDDNTIKINLDEEIPLFEYNLTFPIMSYKYYYNEDFASTSKNDSPVGTGRYKVVNQGNNIYLTLNSNWWNTSIETAKIKKIQIVKYSNMGEVYKAFKIGNIDLINTESLNIEDYIGTIGYNVKAYKGRQIDYIAFNTANDVLSNKEVRLAISYAIDKQNIISAIYGDKYYEAEYPLDYGSYLYQEGKVQHEFNQEKAKTILEENGWEFKYKNWQKTVNYRTIRLRFNLVVNSNNESRVLVAENIKNSLAELGISINIIKVNDATYQKYLENKNYDMILTGKYISLSPDLSSYFEEGNLANYENEDANKIIKEINSITDEKILKEKNNELIEIYKNDMPYIYLYWNRSSLICSSSLMGDIKPTKYNLFNNIETWYRQ